MQSNELNDGSLHKSSHYGQLNFFVYVLKTIQRYLIIDTSEENK